MRRSVAWRTSLRDRREIATGVQKLALAGIKINLIELQSCELFQELALAGIKVNGSEENAQNSL